MSYRLDPDAITIQQASELAVHVQPTVRPWKGSMADWEKPKMQSPACSEVKQSSIAHHHDVCAHAFFPDSHM
jgi:hypothetical protein